MSKNRRPDKHGEDSPDHEIDYRVMYPVEGRTRRSIGTRKPRSEQQETNPLLLRHQRKQTAREHEIERGKNYDDDFRPRKSMIRAAKEIICKHPDISSNDLAEKIEALGYETTPRHIGSVRHDFQDTIKVALEMGYVKLTTRR